MKENKESDKIFRNISDVEMEFSKLIIMYQTNMCESGQGTYYGNRNCFIKL